MGAASQKSIGKDGGVTDVDDEDDANKKGRDADMGPPGFYEDDLNKYYSKFEKSLAERREFKHRMRDKMSFTNTDWNRNCDSLSTTNGNRKSKQVIKVVNGVS